MKYINLFLDITTANTRGSSGLDSPQICMVKDKQVNIVKTSSEKFTCSFNSTTGLIENVTPTPSTVNLSMVDVNGETQAKMETANCYVIKEAGTYKLPLVYGNAIKNDTVNSAAYTQVAPESGNT